MERLELSCVEPKVVGTGSLTTRKHFKNSSGRDVKLLGRPGRLVSGFPSRSSGAARGRGLCDGNVAGEGVGRVLVLSPAR